MKRITRALYAGLIAVMLAACGGAVSPDLATQHSAAGTQLAALRQTDAVQSARLLTTLDFASTQVSLAATQSQLLKATLEANGIPASELVTYQAQVMGALLNPPTPTPTPEAVDGLVPPVTAPALNGATPVPTRPIVTMNAPPATRTPDPDEPRLDDIRLSTSVGSDDCASGSASQFSTATPEIYVSMTVRNAPANTLYTSRWFYEGEELVSFDYQPDFAIDGRCIWFFIDQTDVTFQAGNWRVQLEINGQPVGSGLAFTMTP